MTRGINKVILVGHLGRDPELRQTQGGISVANLHIATSETWNNKDGKKQERTEWHKVVLWDGLAKIADQYLSKGRQVYLEGRIQTRVWNDKKTGEKRYTTEIRGDQILMLGGKGDQSQTTASSPGFQATDEEAPF